MNRQWMDDYPRGKEWFAKILPGEGLLSSTQFSKPPFSSSFSAQNFWIKKLQSRNRFKKNGAVEFKSNCSFLVKEIV
jgi:hypothetical protein